MKKGEQTRERIIDAAAELLRERGYHGTGLNTIVQRAGAPKGSLYFHFPGGKEEICVAAMRTAGDAWQQEILAIVHDAPNLAAGVDAVCSLVARRLETTNFGHGCPVATVALESAATNDALHRACTSVYQTWQTEVEALLIEAGVAESLAPALATTMIAAVEGAILLAKAHRNSEPLSRIATLLSSVLMPSHPGDSPIQ